MNHRRPSKCLPNNGIIATSHRGGVVLAEPVLPEGAARGFKPWSTDQPVYEAWLRELLRGERCQCPDETCRRLGEQTHHEYRGAHKDGRVILRMSAYCHHEVRHHEGCSRAYTDGCKAVALANLLNFQNSLEAAA